MLTIKDVQPYSKNGKEHPNKQLEALAKIVKKVGWRQPVLVNQKGVIVAGHGRFETYQKFREQYELKEIWIIDDMGNTIHGEPEKTPLSAEDEKAYRLADNKLNESNWLMPMVTEDLIELADTGYDITLTGFSADLIAVKEKDDEVPNIPTKDIKTKFGDLYELGDHKILCGDSTIEIDMAKLMAGHKSDMVFTDPPYNVDYKGKGTNTGDGILNDKMSDDLFETFLTDTFWQTKNFLKPGGGCYVFHSHKTASTFEKALEKVGFIIDTQLIWNKPSAGMGMNHYRTKHEPFFYCSLTKEKTFYGDRTGTTVWKIPKNPEDQLKWLLTQEEALESGKTTVWSIARANVNDYVHPTQKPVELPARAMVNSTKQGDIILDQFLGSGTTLIACEKMNRVCYGLELDPKFMDVIIQRWVNYTGKTTIKKNGQEVEWPMTKEVNE